MSTYRKSTRKTTKIISRNMRNRLRPNAIVRTDNRDFSRLVGWEIKVFFPNKI